MKQDIERYSENVSNSVEIYNKNDIIQRWLDSLDVLEDTKETYKAHLIDFIKWINTNGIQRATKGDILKYKQELINRYSNSTVCLKISSLKSFYRFLNEQELANDITKNIKGAKISKGFKRDIFTLEQIQEIMKSIDRTTLVGARDYAMVNLFLRTGLRSCEVNRANIEDIRNKDGEIVLYVQGKGRTYKDEFVVLTATMLEILNHYLNMREQKQHITDTSPLFISLSDRNFGDRLSLFSIRWVAKNIFRDVGIDSKRLTTHSTRHTAITLSLLSGADLIDVKDMARHQSVDTTLLYAHNVKRLENAPEKKLEQVFENIV